MSSRAALDRAIALALTQDGVLSRLQARLCGVDRWAVAHQVESGRWRPYGDQAIAVHRMPLRFRARCRVSVWEAGTKPVTCLNVGVTATGLAALGLRADWLATFPEEFRDGAAARAQKVGDIDASAPEHWRDGLDDPNAVHLMWTIHALDDHAALAAVSEQLEAAWRESGAFSVTSRLDGATLDTYTRNENDRDTVHFGYRDSISQPR